MTHPDELPEGNGPLTYRLFYEYMTERDKTLDSKYAAKWVERAVWLGGVAIISSVIYTLLTHVGVATP